MRSGTLLLVLVVGVGSARADQAARGQVSSGVELTIRAPDAERVEVALDEVELQWRDGRGAPQEQIRAAVGTSRATEQRTTMGATVFAMRDVATIQDVSAVARGLEEQNPGAVAYLVLYEAGRPRSEATRRLLGREVAIMLDDAADAEAMVKILSAFRVRPITSVPRAYVVEAADPMGALALADKLRATPGVKTAYPLLQRRQFTR